MIVGIMQPYLFPYIGYFQLISVCDKFVIHDDVQYIKGGWINKNRILSNGEPKSITLPLRKASSYLPINQRNFVPDFQKQKLKVIRQIETSYRKAPHFRDVTEVLDRCFSNEEENISKFIASSLRLCCDYLDIKTTFIFSSVMEKDDDLKGQSRVINICKCLGADTYINAIGGQELYEKSTFADEGIELLFLRTGDVRYSQLASGFVANLSIIDVMMFNDKEKCHELLREYELI